MKRKLQLMITGIFIISAGFNPMLSQNSSMNNNDSLKDSSEINNDTTIAKADSSKMFGKHSGSFNDSTMTSDDSTGQAEKNTGSSRDSSEAFRDSSNTPGHKEDSSRASGDSVKGFRGENARKMQNRSDSIRRRMNERRDSILAVKNKHVDSLIQVKNKIQELHLYMADTSNSRKNAAVMAMIRKMDRARDTLQRKLQSQLKAREMKLDSIMAKHDSAIGKQIRLLDSLEMFNDSVGQTDPEKGEIIRAMIKQNNQKIDSMIQIKAKISNQFKEHMDSLARTEKWQIKRQLQEKQEKIDSIVGIRSKTKIKIKAKNKTAKGDSAVKKLNEVIEAMVFMDSNKVCIKFNRKLKNAAELKKSFKLKATKQLKSTHSDYIDIDEVIFNENKEYLAVLVTSEPIEDPDLVELEFNGEVDEDETDGITILTQTTSINNLSSHSFNVYPNPATNYIKVTNMDKIKTVFIINTDGSVTKILSNVFAENIPVSDLPSNMYFIRIIDNSGKAHTSKFYKK